MTTKQKNLSKDIWARTAETQPFFAFLSIIQNFSLGQIVSAPLVENYPGILSISGAELAQKMTEQAKSLGAELLSAEATGLSKTQNGFLVSCADGALEARTVILALSLIHI